MTPIVFAAENLSWESEDVGFKSQTPCSSLAPAREKTFDTQSLYLSGADPENNPERDNPERVRIK